LVGWSCFVRSAVRLAPAGGGLALRVEVDGGDGEAEVVLLSELAGAEAVLGRRRVHSLPALLPEQHKDEPVDANVWLWGLVAHHLSPCMYIYAWQALYGGGKEWRGEGEDKEPVIDLYTTTLFTHFSPF